MTKLTREGLINRTIDNISATIMVPIIADENDDQLKKYALDHIGKVTAREAMIYINDNEITLEEIMAQYEKNEAGCEHGDVYDMFAMAIPMFYNTLIKRKY